MVLHLIQDYDTGVGRGIQQSHQKSMPGNTGPSGSSRSTFVECRTFVQMPTGMTTLSRQPDMNKKHRIKETVHLGQLAGSHRGDEEHHTAWMRGTCREHSYLHC